MKLTTDIVTFNRDLLFHDEDHVRGRVEDVDQVNYAWSCGAKGHQGDFMQDLRRAVLTVTQLGRVLGCVLHTGHTVPTFTHRCK